MLAQFLPDWQTSDTEQLHERLGSSGLVLFYLERLDLTVTMVTG